MKELSIEEKAKRYDEALEKAKNWQNHLYEISDKDYADELNYLFSELAESEDEKIRKFLIKCVNQPMGTNFLDGINKNAVLNWLESLRPQNHWKPSDLQIEALESAAENCAYSEYQDCLRELIGQLKKLTE